MRKHFFATLLPILTLGVFVLGVTIGPMTPPAIPAPAPAVELCPMGMYMGGEVTAKALYIAGVTQQDPAPPSQEPPTTTPPEYDPNSPDGDNPPVHTEPTEFCTPHAQGAKPACGCTTDALGRAGCKAGQRDVEVQHCASWCWKQWCHCCRS